MLHVIYIGLKQNVYSISSVPTALLRYAAASHHDGEREELLDIRLSRSGDEVLSLWWCLDDYNLGKAMCGEAVLASQALSRVRRVIGTFYLLTQKLVFHNSDLNILYTTSLILMLH
jgi:hypothetical protein